MSRLRRLTVRTIENPMRTIFLLLIILLTPLAGAAQDINRNLIDAAFEGKTRTVEALLAEGADINVKDGMGLGLQEKATLKPSSFCWPRVLIRMSNYLPVAQQP